MLATSADLADEAALTASVPETRRAASAAGLPAVRLVRRPTARRGAREQKTDPGARCAPLHLLAGVDTEPLDCTRHAPRRRGRVTVRGGRAVQLRDLRRGPLLGCPVVTAPTIGVLALQGDVREHLARWSGPARPAAPVRRPAELDGVDGLVLPGRRVDHDGQAGARLRPARAAARAALRGGHAGVRLLRRDDPARRPGRWTAPPDQETLGGLDMTVRRNAFGRQVDSFEGDVDIGGLDGGPLHAVFIRAPWVEEVGPDVEVLARVEDGPAAGRIVAVRQGRCWPRRSTPR